MKGRRDPEISVSQIIIPKRQKKSLRLTEYDPRSSRSPLRRLRVVGSARYFSALHEIILELPDRNLSLVLMAPEILKLTSSYQMLKRCSVYELEAADEGDSHEQSSYADTNESR